MMATNVLLSLNFLWWELEMGGEVGAYHVSVGLLIG